MKNEARAALAQSRALGSRDASACWARKEPRGPPHPPVGQWAEILQPRTARPREKPCCFDDPSGVQSDGTRAQLVPLPRGRLQTGTAGWVFVQAKTGDGNPVMEGWQRRLRSAITWRRPVARREGNASAQPLI